MRVHALGCTFFTSEEGANCSCGLHEVPSNLATATHLARAVSLCLEAHRVEKYGAQDPRSTRLYRAFVGLLENTEFDGRTDADAASEDLYDRLRLAAGAHVAGGYREHLDKIREYHKQECDDDCGLCDLLAYVPR